MDTPDPTTVDSILNRAQDLLDDENAGEVPESDDHRRGELDARQAEADRIREADADDQQN